MKDLNSIKNAMLAYKDFYGGDIMWVDEIVNAKSKKELSGIIEKYRSHLEDMLCDAHSHLDNFKKRIGLSD